MSRRPRMTMDAVAPERAREDRTSDSTGLEADRRRTILEAAIRVIGERGFANTRLVDVADAAGVSIGLLQHYFRTRDRLIEEALATHHADFLATLDSIANGSGEPADRLATLLRYLCTGTSDRASDLTAIESEWATWVEYWDAAMRQAAIARQSSDLYDAWHALFRRLIEDGVAAGTFHSDRPVDDVVDQFLGMLDGLMIRAKLQHPTIDGKRFAALLADFLAHALGAALPATGGEPWEAGSKPRAGDADPA